MKKKALISALLSTVLLVGCNTYSKVSAEKAKEVQTENLKKEVTYTKAVTSTIVSKLDVDVKGENLGQMKETIVAATKTALLAALGVNEVGKKVEKETTNTTEMSMYRLPAEMFTEQEGTTYYTSGSKIKVVSKAKENGLNGTDTILINEYGYMTLNESNASGETTESGLTISIKLSYKTSIKYTK